MPSAPFFFEASLRQDMMQCKQKAWSHPMRSLFCNEACEEKQNCKLSAGNRFGRVDGLWGRKRR